MNGLAHGDSQQEAVLYEDEDNASQPQRRRSLSFNGNVGEGNVLSTSVQLFPPARDHLLRENHPSPPKNKPVSRATSPFDNNRSPSIPFGSPLRLAGSKPSEGLWSPEVALSLDMTSFDTTPPPHLPTSASKAAQHVSSRRGTVLGSYMQMARATDRKALDRLTARDLRTMVKQLKLLEIQLRDKHLKDSATMEEKILRSWQLVHDLEETLRSRELEDEAAEDLVYTHNQLNHMTSLLEDMSANLVPVFEKLAAYHTLKDEAVKKEKFMKSIKSFTVRTKTNQEYSEKVLGLEAAVHRLERSNEKKSRLLRGPILSQVHRINSNASNNVTPLTSPTAARSAWTRTRSTSKDATSAPTTPLPATSTSTSSTPSTTPTQTPTIPRTLKKQADVFSSSFMDSIGAQAVVEESIAEPIAAAAAVPSVDSVEDGLSPVIEIVGAEAEEADEVPAAVAVEAAEPSPALQPAVSVDMEEEVEEEQAAAVDGGDSAPSSVEQPVEDIRIAAEIAEPEVTVSKEPIDEADEAQGPEPVAMDAPPAADETVEERTDEREPDILEEEEVAVVSVDESPEEEEHLPEPEVLEQLAVQEEEAEEKELAADAIPDAADAEQDPVSIPSQELVTETSDAMPEASPAEEVEDVPEEAAEPSPEPTLEERIAAALLGTHTDAEVIEEPVVEPVAELAVDLAEEIIEPLAEESAPLPEPPPVYDHLPVPPAAAHVEMIVPSPTRRAVFSHSSDEDDQDDDDLIQEIPVRRPMDPLSPDSPPPSYNNAISMQLPVIDTFHPSSKLVLETIFEDESSPISAPPSTAHFYEPNEAYYENTEISVLDVPDNVSVASSEASVSTKKNRHRPSVKGLVKRTRSLLGIAGSNNRIPDPPFGSPSSGVGREDMKDLHMEDSQSVSSLGSEQALSAKKGGFSMFRSPSLFKKSKSTNSTGIIGSPGAADIVESKPSGTDGTSSTMTAIDQPDDSSLADSTASQKKKKMSVGKFFKKMF